jgi:hypothetical protein
MLQHPFTTFSKLTCIFDSSFAIPALARVYGSSCCSTRHIAFPELNDFGRAFKGADFKFPRQL